MSEAYPQLAIGSRGQWRAWLAAYHDRAAGVWVVTFKKGSGRPYVAYDEVVECLVVAGRSRPAGPCSKSRRRPSLGWSSEQRPGWVVGQDDGADVDEALAEQRTAIRFYPAA